MTEHNPAGHPDLYAGQTAQIPPLDIAGMLRVMWHGKWLIFSVFLLFTTLMGYYAFRVAQPQYAATATLQMDQPGNPMQDAPQPPDMDEAALNTSVAQVTSDAVLTNVIARLDLMSDPEFNRYLVPARPLSPRSLRTNLRHFLAGTSPQDPDAAAIHEKTIQNLRGALAVMRQPDTYILRITARSGDPAKAAHLANTTATQYLAYIDAQQMQARKEAEVWLQTRVTDLRAQLEAQQLQATSLIATAQLQEDSGLDTLSAQVLAADQSLIAAENALTALQNAPESGSTRNAAEIAQMRDKIAEITALRNRLSAQLSSQSAGLAQLQQIQLQIDATRLLYQTFLGRLQENRMQQGLTTPNIQRISPAAEGIYIGPRKILILTIAAMLGANIGVLLVSVLHNLRKGAMDARSLQEATGLPVLAQFSTRALRHMQKGRRSLPLPPGAALAQAAQGLHTALSLTMRGQAAQVILSTSSVQAEGKTELAIALAHTLAMSGKRVVLVGADDRNPRLGALTSSEIFEQAQASWLDGEGNARDARLGADILVLPAFSDAHGALLSDMIVDKLQALRKTYDHIVIDGPPVLLSPDARLIASHADAIIYAVRWAKTPLDVVARGLGALAGIGKPATGLVLSRVNMRRMRKLSSDPCVRVVHSPQAI